MRITNLLQLALISILISCSDDYFTTDCFSEMSEMVNIAESEEMYAYVKARLSYDNLLLCNDTTLMERVYINDSTYCFVISTTDAFNNTHMAESSLLQKYPEFQSYPFEKKHDLFSMTINKHMELQKLCGRRLSFFVQTKCNNADTMQAFRAYNELKRLGKIENNNITSGVQPFNTYSEAYDRCREFPYETGGYIYYDNSALFYLPARPDTSQHEVWFDPFSVNPKPEEAFHYHPGGTLNFSHGDTVAAKRMKGLNSSFKYTNIITDRFVYKMPIFDKDSLVSR